MLLSTLLALLISITPAQAQARFDPTAIDRLFQSYDKPNAPGAVVLIHRDGMLPYRKGYGLGEVETSTRATPATNFRMASVSKQFTAMAVLILVDQGDLALEDTLTEVFPDFPAYGSQITIRHLLHHTSGLKNYEGLISQSGQVNDADVLNIMKAQRAGDFTPGSRYRYSNSGYCVLSQVVEKRSGLPYAQFITENIFNELGMIDSRVYERDTPPLIPHRAYGYTPTSSGFRKTDQSQTSSTQGDGGIYTSAEDYERWTKGLDTLLSPTLLQAMFTPGKLNNGSTHSYGMGWVINTYRGLTRYSHTGSTIGFRTAVETYPEKGFTVAVFINRAASSPWTLARQITDHVLFGAARDSGESLSRSSL